MRVKEKETPTVSPKKNSFPFGFCPKVLICLLTETRKRREESRVWCRVGRTGKAG